MGTPVSKTGVDNSSSPTNADGKIYRTGNDIEVRRSSIGATRRTSKRGSVCYEAPPNTTNTPSVASENDFVQTTNTAEDDEDDTEWNDIYNRLKTNKYDDLHVLDSKNSFQDDSTYPAHGAPTPMPGSGPVFASNVAERNTRINSANFNPHAVAFEREKTRIKTALLRKAEIAEDNSSGGEEHQTQPLSTSDDADDTNIRHTGEEDVTDANIVTFAADNDTINTAPIDTSIESTERTHIDNEQADDTNYLGLPENERHQLSQLHVNPNDNEEADIDPLEGLDIPRPRLYSIGSASIYSVMEISDDVYQQNMSEIKTCIRSYGFFEAFPSPSIVGEAQKIYRMLDMPSPVDEDGNVLPHPPKVTKADYIASEMESFDAVRDKVRKMPKELQNDGEMVDIVHYLCEGLDDDMSKLVMLVAWNIQQQVKSADNKATQMSRDVWIKRFKTMCKFARVRTRLIKGILRDSQFIPGNELSKHRGIWLAVLANHTWLLVDPVIEPNTKGDNNNSRKAGQDLFQHVEKVFQDPEHFIFSHFPDAEHWQLLARPVNKKELAELAVVRQGFFDLGMTIVNQAKSVLVTKTPEITMTLSFPLDVQPKFKCKLQMCDKKMSAARMRTYVFLETLFNEQLVRLIIRFPKHNEYILDLYAATENSDWMTVMSTKLVYEGSEVAEPFPDNPKEEWGPGLDTAMLGLVPKTHFNGEIVMQKGIVQIVFADKERLQFSHVLFREDIKIDPSCLNVSFLKDKNNDVVFVVDINTKIQGVFILQLLARADKRADYTNFCNYLIRKEKAVVIPRLEFNSNKDANERPINQAPESGTLHVIVDATGLIQISVELKLHDRQELNFSEHARHWIAGDEGHIDLNFPRRGKYSLKVLGRTVLKGRFKTLRDEVIIVNLPSERWSSFPKECSHWNSWYKIEEPLTHHLEEKQDVMFKVEIKNALDVAVLAPNGWYHLGRQGETWEWHGQVWTGPKSTRCQLLARFEVGSGKWSELLWFKVMAEEDFERMEERQESAIEIARRDIVY